MALKPSAYITGQPDGPYCWVDVTTELFKSVQDLDMGELVHDELFGLFEAMSAIEMMDPKMDAGMHCNRGENSRKPLNFEQAIKSGKLKLADLSHTELISIIDASMCCLVTWLEGHSLAQTLFINLYLHQPYQIEDKILRAFCTVMLHTVDIIKDYVNKAMVFEEEDFQPVLYGYRLNYEVSEQKALSSIKETEEEVHKTVKSTRAKGGNEERDELTLRMNQEATALHVRLKFTRLFMQSLSLGKKESTNVEEMLRCLNSASEALRVWKTSFEALAVSCDVNNVMGFEPMINQRLLPPTFPRYTKIKELGESLEYLDELLGRLKHICNIAQCTNFRLALDFFNEFARTSPCVLSRSVLQLLYLPLSNRVLNQANMADVLRDSAKLFISPPSLAPKSPVLQYPQAKECLDSFFQHCVRPFGSLVQIAGHNLARQRDKLARVLEDFAALQEEADKVDAFFHTLSLKTDNPRPHLACLGTWVLFYTLRIMIQYLLLGFELGLYSKHEYHYIYWYLYEFLYGWLISAYSRADGFLAEQEALECTAKGGRGGNKKVNSGGSKPKKNKKNHPYNREIILHQAIQNMCGGFYKACTGFSLDGKIKGPNPEFGSEQVRYDHRFAPFSAVLTPPPVQYAQFRDMTSLGPDVGKYHSAPTVMALYLAACKHFHQARTLLESITADQEVSDMLRVCKTNFVVMKLLAGGHKKDSQSPPEFDFTAHRHFPLIKIT